MHTKTNRRCLTSLVAILQLMMSVLWVLPASSVHAQGIDSEPPTIEFEAIDQGFIEDSQVFTATVSDDTEVQTVTLYYRFDSEELYKSRRMEMLGSAGIYTATIGTDLAPEGTTAIQYYLEALDGVSNRTLQGFAFDPIERELIDVPVPVPVAVAEPVAAPVQVGGISTGRKILYGVLGLVVVGAIAAASSSSGGGGDSQPGVPITINVQELP